MAAIAPITFTSEDLQALIWRAVRRSGRSIEDIGVQILPRKISRVGEDLHDDIRTFLAGAFRLGGPDLSDPGTARMLVPLLALAHGQDPGPGGRACCWFRGGRLCKGRESWVLQAETGRIDYVAQMDVGDELEFVAPDIANEPDDLRALILACKLAVKE